MKSTSLKKKWPFKGKGLFPRKLASYEFWGPMLNQSVLLSAEMFNMLNVLGGVRRRPQTKISNIFNISAERMRFFKKSHSFRRNVEYFEFWGAC